MVQILQTEMWFYERFAIRRLIRGCQYMHVRLMKCCSVMLAHDIKMVVDDIGTVVEDIKMVVNDIKMLALYSLRRRTLS